MRSRRSGKKHIPEWSFKSGLVKNVARQKRNQYEARPSISGDPGGGAAVLEYGDMTDKLKIRERQVTDGINLYSEYQVVGPRGKILSRHDSRRSAEQWIKKSIRQ